MTFYLIFQREFTQIGHNFTELMRKVVCLYIFRDTEGRLFMYVAEFTLNEKGIRILCFDEKISFLFFFFRK